MRSCLDRPPIGEIVEARALDRGERDRRDEGQALHHQHGGENIDLAHLLEVGRDTAIARADQQQAGDDRLPKRRGSRPLRRAPPLAVRTKGR